MIELSLNNTPPEVPNPPPWRVYYVNDSDKEIDHTTDVLPEAYTKGLSHFDKPELLLRLAPPKLASLVLDRIGVWLVYEKNYLSPDLSLSVEGTVYKAVPTDKTSLYRLSWTKDPA